MPLNIAHSGNPANRDASRASLSTNHLVLMFKAPQRAKSRLRNRLGQSTDELAKRLFQCALEDLGRWPGPVALAATDTEDAAWLSEQSLWPERALLQGPGNLGERLAQVDLALRRQGAERVIFIGSDCPAMDGDYLRQAAAQLDHEDFVLGKALDGGVSLMGARRPWPLLADLPWSSHRLGTALAERCNTSLLLPALRDVDDVEDLAPLLAELASDDRPSRIELRHWLTAWLT